MVKNLSYLAHGGFFFSFLKNLFILGDLTHAPCSESKEEILTTGLPGNFLSWNFRIDSVPGVNVRAWLDSPYP